MKEGGRIARTDLLNPNSRCLRRCREVSLSSISPIQESINTFQTEAEYVRSVLARGRSIEQNGWSFRRDVRMLLIEGVPDRSSLVVW